MFSANRAKFVLEGHSSVMLALLLNVPNHRLDIRLTYGKRAVAVLPMERVQVRRSLLDPLRRFPLQNLDQFRDCYSTGEAAQHMHVIDPAADASRWTINFLGMISQHAEHFFSDRFISEKCPPLLGAEHDMQPYPRQGLRHFRLSSHQTGTPCEDTASARSRQFASLGPKAHGFAQPRATPWEILAKRLVFSRPNGPTVHRAARQTIGPLDRITTHRTNRDFHLSQGVALGWTNGRPFGAKKRFSFCIWRRRLTPEPSLSLPRSVSDIPRSLGRFRRPRRRQAAGCR